MKSILLATWILIFLSACTNSSDRANPELDDVKKKKYSIDSLISDKSLGVFAKVAGKKDLVEVVNRRYPAGLELTYNVLKDEDGRVVYVAELPYSAESDYFIAYKSYFDTGGKLIAFQRINNFMHSECVRGAAMETMTKYYNAAFEVLDSTYTLTDTKKQPLEKVKCKFPYDFPYQIYKTLEEYQASKGIKGF